MDALAPPFDPKEFRRALGMFATGVTIVTTTAADGTPIGITANSFNSVSLDPPMVLWSLAKKSHSLAAFSRCSHWAVHVLAADQEELSSTLEPHVEHLRAERVPRRGDRHDARGHFVQRPFRPRLEGRFSL